MQTSYTGTDRSGNLWLFGGDGFDSTSKVGQLNDLWMYDISLKEGPGWEGAALLTWLHNREHNMQPARRLRHIGEFGSE